MGDSNRSTLKLYLNGVLHGNFTGITMSNFGTSSSAMRVAGFVNNTVTPAYFQGAIDEISLWNTTMPTADVNALRTYKPVGGTSNLIGYWSLDEGTGTTAANGLTSAASATNLTLTNASWLAAALDPASGSYSEQALATAINPMVGVFDLDRTIITATVRITSGFMAGDILSMTPITSTMGSIQVSSYLTNTGVLTLVAPTPATPIQWTTALRAITFANALSDNPGTTRTLGFSVQSANNTASEQTLSFVVTPINDAPTAVNTTLTSIAEDVTSAANTGTSVATIASTNTDPDTGASKGLAITGVNTSDGQWQYTSNGGTSWTTISNVSDSAALLLPGSNSNYKVRFVPVNNFYGSATFTFRAWDESSGSAGSSANTTSNGGITAFSSTTATATITITNTLDPFYVSVKNATNAAQFDGSSSYLGNSNSTLNSLGTFTLALWINPSRLANTQGVIGQNDAVEVSLITTAGTTTLTVYSAGTGRSDTLDVTGIIQLNTWTHLAIVGDANRGSVKVYLDGILRGNFSGSAISSFGSSANAMRVGGFVTDNTTANYFQGRIDEISLWNSIYDVAEINALRAYHPLTTTNNLVGYWSLDVGSGSTAANSASGASSATNLTLTSTTWVAASLAPAVGVYNEQAVPIAINPLVGVFDSEQSVITATVRISGGFTTGDILSMTPITSTMGGIQVASYSAGTLTLVAPSGTTPLQWSTALRAITFSNTISDNPGTSRTLAFRLRNAVSTGNEQSMTFSVVPVNDAPVAVNTVLTSIAEDVTTAANSGDSVASLVSAHTDRDSGASKAMAITAVDTRNGQWQFSSNSGSSWSTMTGISASTALLLPGSTSAYRIRFVPDPNYVGDATVTFRAWDESSGSAGLRADTTSNGGSTPFSSDTATATISVLSSTDAIQFSVAYTHKAVQFNGSNAYLSNAHTSLNALRDMTLAFWMKPDLLSGTQSLIGQNDVLEVSLTSTGATTTLDIWSAASNTTDSIDVSTVLSVGSWAHVVIVGDAGMGTLDVYINGALIGSTTFTASDTFGSSSNSLRVAGYVGDNTVANYYHGQIDEISIWNSTFPVDTIAGLRYYRPVSTTPNLVAYWACDEGTSNSIANAVSGAPVGSNLTLNGATAWVNSTLNASGGNYVEQNPSFFIRPFIGLMDIDARVISATVRITSGFSTTDSLALTINAASMGNITALPYSSGDGTLTLTSAGGATASQWVTALRAVRFTNPTDFPGTSRTIAYAFATASGSTSEQSITFTIVPDNDAPVARNDIMTSISEDMSDVANGGTTVASIVDSSTDVDVGDGGNILRMRAAAGVISATYLTTTPYSSMPVPATTCSASSQIPTSLALLH